MTDMILKTLVVGPLEVNCYVIGDAAGGPMGIVDPGGDADRIMAVVEHLNRPVSFILNTHCHFDHVGGVNDLVRGLKTDYLIHCNEKPVLAGIKNQMDMFGFPAFEPPVPSRYLTDNQKIELGRLALNIIHIPGHSPGGMCIYCEQTQQLLTGDSLFRESVGRTDLPGGDTDTLLTAIRDRLLILPKEVRVYPGHGPTTTIGHELKYNPFL